MRDQGPYLLTTTNQTPWHEGEWALDGVGRNGERAAEGAGVVLHDGDDEVGVEVAEPQAAGEAEQAFAGLGCDDGGVASLDLSADADGEDPPRVVAHQGGGRSAGLVQRVGKAGA